MTDRTGRQTVVPDDDFIQAENEAARRDAGAVLEPTLLQPFIQRRFATVEVCQNMVGRDRPGRRESAGAHFSQGALVLSSRRTLSVGGSGLSSRDWNLEKVSASTVKNV